MNPEITNPLPESRPTPESTTSTRPKIPQAAVTPHPSAHSFNPEIADDFTPYPPANAREDDTEYDFGDYDYQGEARERQILLDDLASDCDDFSRSEEDGWYYSDED